MRKFITGITSVLLAVSFTSCGGSTSAKNEGAGKKAAAHTINVATSGDAALVNPLIQLAEEKGYYKDYGLGIEYSKLGNPGAEMYDALSVGKVEAAFAQAVPPISYGAQGYDVTIIGGVLSGGMFAVTRPENYDELKDIKNWAGHSVGVIQMSTSELTTRNAFKHDYGIDPDKDIKYVMIEDYPSISLSVQKGNVDVGFIGNTYVESALDQGLKVVTELYDIKKDYVCCRQSAYSQKLAEDREAYVLYLAGQIKAYKDINTEKDETKKFLSKATGETEQYIEDYIYDVEKSGHRTYNPDPNYNGIQGLYEIMLEQKYVESELTLDQFTDLSVYADALKKVIAENPNDSFYTDMRDYFKENNNEYPDFDNIYGDSFWNA